MIIVRPVDIDMSFVLHRYESLFQRVQDNKLGRTIRRQSILEKLEGDGDEEVEVIA
jgi:hypothetical protein